MTDYDLSPFDAVFESLENGQHDQAGRQIAEFPGGATEFFRHCRTSADAGNAHPGAASIARAATQFARLIEGSR